MFRYSVEKPIAGATTAYIGKNAIVKRKEPGIAATVYFVQMLRMEGEYIGRDGNVRGNVLGNERGFAEHGQQDGEVERCSPEPMTRVKAVRLLQIAPEQDDREPEQDLVKTRLETR